MAITNFQSLSEYFQKIKHNGIKWGLKQTWKLILFRFFQYNDRTLIIFKTNLNDLKGFHIDPSIINVTFNFVLEKDKKKVIDLNFSDLSEEIVNMYYKKGSECYGAFLKERLIACSWCHLGEFYFPYYIYKLVMQDTDGYGGPDYVIPEFRGNNLQPALLSRLAKIKINRGYTIGYGSVEKDNIASLKGVSKLNIQAWRTIRVKRIFNFLITREEHAQRP